MNPPRGIRVEVPFAAWLDMTCGNYRMQPHTYLYGAMCSLSSSPAGTYVDERTLISSTVYAILVVVSVAMKRRSALRPGGRVYRYNQRRVRDVISDKRRRLRDMLADPLLARDMERRCGDLTGLREKVAEWEGDDFVPQKKEEEEFVRNGGTVYIPWLRLMTIWLYLVIALTFYCNANMLTTMILIASLVHAVDNALIQRAALARWGGGKDRSGKSKTGGIVAAVGVPVPEVEAGVLVV